MAGQSATNMHAAVLELVDAIAHATTGTTCSIARGPGGTEAKAQTAYKSRLTVGHVKAREPQAEYSQQRVEAHASPYHLEPR